MICCFMILFHHRRVLLFSVSLLSSLASCQATNRLIYGPGGEGGKVVTQSSLQNSTTQPAKVRQAKLITRYQPNPIKPANIDYLLASTTDQKAETSKKPGFFGKIFGKKEAAPAIEAAQASASQERTVSERSKPATAPVVVAPTPEKTVPSKKPGFFGKLFGKKETAPSVEATATAPEAIKPAAKAEAAPKARKESGTKTAAPKRARETDRPNPKPRKKTQEEPSSKDSASGSEKASPTSTASAPEPAVPSASPSPRETAPPPAPVALPKKPEPIPAVVKPTIVEPKAVAPAAPKPEIRAE